MYVFTVAQPTVQANKGEFINLGYAAIIVCIAPQLQCPV